MKLLMKIFRLLLLSYDVKNFPVIGNKNLFFVHCTVLVWGGMGEGALIWRKVKVNLCLSQVANETDAYLRFL